MSALPPIADIQRANARIWHRSTTARLAASTPSRSSLRALISADWFFVSRFFISSSLYALVCEFEIILHRAVRHVLKSTYAEFWWQRGIPEQTRKNCQIRKEEDATPVDDPYHYTTFIDLKSIIDKNWNCFSVELPKTLTINKQNTLQRLQRVNDIRNRVMHPVKPITEYEDDYRFIRKFLRDFGVLAVA
jgi:hypothetical protein